MCDFDLDLCSACWASANELLAKRRIVMSKESFTNLPNFREVGGGRLVNKNGKRLRSGVLYRASRTDFLTEEEIKTFLGFGFKTIIDMRTKSEFERADGEKLLVKHYEPLVLRGNGVDPFKPSFRWGGKLKKSMKEAERQKSESLDSKWMGKRYLANMFSREFLMHMIYKVNFISRYFAMVLLAIDWFLGSHLLPKFFSWAVVNSQTLPEQYVDMLEYSKKMVRNILRLLLDEENLPVMMNCTHGKDRTGVLVTVILACLDMSEEDIVADYTQSKVGLASIKQRMIREIGRYGLNPKFTEVEAHSIQQTSNEIKKRYGSWANYLESTGFTQEDQNKLKQVLLVASD